MVSGAQMDSYEKEPEFYNEDQMKRDHAYNATQEDANPLYKMDSDELVSRMILADRSLNNDDFVRFRRELLYRLRCAEPLVNWNKPKRFEDIGL